MFKAINVATILAATLGLGAVSVLFGMGCMKYFDRPKLAVKSITVLMKRNASEMETEEKFRQHLNVEFVKRKWSRIANSSYELQFKIILLSAGTESPYWAVVNVVHDGFIEWTYNYEQGQGQSMDDFLREAASDLLEQCSKSLGFNRTPGFSLCLTILKILWQVLQP
jgi:hypothetical protein